MLGCRELELLRQSVMLQTQAKLREARARLGDDTSTAVSGGVGWVVPQGCCWSAVGVCMVRMALNHASHGVLDGHDICIPMQSA
jgi:hypothetical protein